MKKQIELKDCTGKTITDQGRNWNGEVVLVFGDEFLCLTVETGYDGDTEVIDGVFEESEWPDDVVISLGIMTSDEMSAKREQEKAEREARALRMKHMQYKNLKRELNL